MAIFRRPDFPVAGRTSDAVPSLSCSVHEEGLTGLTFLLPVGRYVGPPLSPCIVRRV